MDDDPQILRCGCFTQMFIVAALIHHGYCHLAPSSQQLIVDLTRPGSLNGVVSTHQHLLQHTFNETNL